MSDAAVPRFEASIPSDDYAPDSHAVCVLAEDHDCVVAALTREREALHQEVDRLTERVVLFSRQLSVQEQRTGEWHIACEAAEQAHAALQAQVEQLVNSVNDYRKARCGWWGIVYEAQKLATLAKQA